MATFSVIVPTLNEAENIARAIASAGAAGAEQIIVADGGSTDDTLTIAKRAGALTVSSPPGRAKQQNAGAKQATGDWLLFLHADTWLDSQVARQIPPLLENPQAQVAAFRQCIDAPGLLYRWLERGNAWRARRGTAYGDQGILLRRSLFHSLGGFPDIPLMEDVRLMRRLKPYRPLQLLPGPLHVSARRWQKNGVLRQTLRNWTLLTAERCGVSPHHLVHWYKPHAATPTAKRSKS